jgi:rare lipoprotein A
VKILALLSLLAISNIAEARSIVASWYDHGTQTANGEKFYPDGLSAAHKTLPFGTKLRLKYKDRRITVRINDRGPFIGRRELDLSRGAAKRLGLTGVDRLELLKVVKPKLEKKKWLDQKQ